MKGCDECGQDIANETDTYCKSCLEFWEFMKDFTKEEQDEMEQSVRTWVNRDARYHLNDRS
jgi:hypothetical protein